VDGKTIGQVHGAFLGDPSPTDVITFQHGEILICPEVAKEQAPRFASTVEREVLLYGIHGLLHLCGWSDKTTKQQAKMNREQERILRVVFKEKK